MNPLLRRSGRFYKIISRCLYLCMMVILINLMVVSDAAAACSLTFNIGSDANVTISGSGTGKTYKREFTTTEYENCDQKSSNFSNNRPGISSSNGGYDPSPVAGNNGSSLYLNQETPNFDYFEFTIGSATTDQYFYFYTYNGSDWVNQVNVRVVVAPAATAPGAPTGVNATPGNGAASVSFTAPGSTGGASITGYTVTASPGGAMAIGTSSPITVTGLNNGTAYTFTVTATNSAGTGNASTASSAVTPRTGNL